MHHAELRVRVDKNGALYTRSKGIEYPNLDEGQFAYVQAKAAEVATHVQAMKSVGGDFSITLEADADGKPLSVVKSGLSLSQVLDVEEHMGNVQLDMVRFSRMVLKAAGRL